MRDTLPLQEKSPTRVQHVSLISGPSELLPTSGEFPGCIVSHLYIGER